MKRSMRSVQKSSMMPSYKLIEIGNRFNNLGILSYDGEFVVVLILLGDGNDVSLIVIFIIFLIFQPTTTFQTLKI